MSQVNKDLKYTASHEWVKTEADGSVTVGITDHAQALLGDMVFVELPEVGATVTQGKECSVVESVKAASDVYSPLSGTITAINEAVTADPGLVNREPYTNGWLFKVKPSQTSEMTALLSAEAYESQVAEGH